MSRTITSVDALFGVTKFTVQTSLASISLDFVALNVLSQHLSRGPVSISITPITTLTGEAKAVIGRRPVFDFVFENSKGKKIISFGKGTITRSIP